MSSSVPSMCPTTRSGAAWSKTQPSRPGTSGSKNAVIARARSTGSGGSPGSVTGPTSSPARTRWRLAPAGGQDDGHRPTALGDGLQLEPGGEGGGQQLAQRQVGGAHLVADALVRPRVGGPGAVDVPGP